MFKRLKSLFATERSPEMRSVATIETVIAPDEPFFAIGDIHGCADLMEATLTRIRAETGGDVPIILLGDYVDRGPQSAHVLRRLFELQSENPDEIICLKGNHEVMMLDFIDDPAGPGARWIQFGGDRTIQSFGIGRVKKTPDFDEALDMANKLESAMPDGLQDWIRHLPLHWSSGNMHCVHAAMDPNRPVLDQREQVLLWGHEDFFGQPRDDEMCVVHGHTVVPRPLICDGRISIDTGAYETGRLTAVEVTSGKAGFL